MNAWITNAVLAPPALLFFAGLIAAAKVPAKTQAIAYICIGLCLIFGMSSADPWLSIRRLVCLTGGGFAPTGINVLA